MRPADSSAALPLLAVGVLLMWTAGVSVRARAATPHAAEYRVSGNRSVRSLQGLLGFLHGFRLGHGLSAGLHAHFAPYNLFYHPVQTWYPPIVVTAPAQPGNQQQIVNLLGANDVGENYQELNGHNGQVIKGFGEPVRKEVDNASIIKTIENLKRIINETYTTVNDDSNELVETHNPRVKVREALIMNASLTDALSEKAKYCNDSANCTLIDPSANDTTPLTEFTDTLEATIPNEITTSENEVPNVTDSTSSPTYPFSPELIYPNRTFPYPYEMYNRINIDEISITTDVTTPHLAGTQKLALHPTYLQTLALPLEENDWEQFAKIKLGDSGFRPINGNYYYHL